MDIDDVPKANTEEVIGLCMEIKALKDKRDNTSDLYTVAIDRIIALESERDMYFSDANKMLDKALDYKAERDSLREALDEIVKISSHGTGGLRMIEIARTALEVKS